MPTYARLISHLASLSIAVSLAGAACAQRSACPAALVVKATAADYAYSEGDFTRAEEMYEAGLVLKPHDLTLAARLVRTRLRLGMVTEAAAVATRLTTENPQSAVALTTLAEVQLRQGRPWAATENLQAAARIDPCYARTHLVRSRVDRIDSMHASERREIRTAYELDPVDPEIRSAWRTTVSALNDVVSVQQVLASPGDIAPAAKQRIEQSMQALMTQLSGDSPSCQVVPAVPTVSLPLLPATEDGRHIDAYRLEARFPQTSALLEVDTAASGVYISRALADANGLQPAEGGMPGTVSVARMQIGPLELRNCTVGVSEAPFPGRTEGFIGTDVFASYLITLDYAQAKLVLAPLPPVKDDLPGDRSLAAELEGFVPVYHKDQFLLIPTLLNNKEQRLFVLDTGLRYSTMTSDVAHEVSTTEMNFTNAVATPLGGTLQFYRDSFDFEFAHVALPHQAHILEFDTTALERTAGLQIGGMLGFDMLHSMTMQLDYRDGLVRLTAASPDAVATIPGLKSTRMREETGGSACAHLATEEYATSQTIEATTMGFWDSGHQKIGEPVTLRVMRPWSNEMCTLLPGALLYGHVTAATSSKKSGNAKMAVKMDQGDCYGIGRQILPLKILSLAGLSTESEYLHNDLPLKLSHSARSIKAAADNMGGAVDQNLKARPRPEMIRSGKIVGLPSTELDTEGGPACSTLLRSAETSIKLQEGTDVYLVMLNQM